MKSKILDASSKDLTIESLRKARDQVLKNSWKLDPPSFYLSSTQLAVYQKFLKESQELARIRQERIENKQLIKDLLGIKK